MKVTEAMLICKGCGGERRVYFDPPIIGADELDAWMHGYHERHPGPQSCTHCNAKACDIRIPIPSEERPT